MKYTVKTAANQGSVYIYDEDGEYVGLYSGVDDEDAIENAKRDIQFRRAERVIGEFEA